MSGAFLGARCGLTGLLLAAALAGTGCKVDWSRRQLKLQTTLGEEVDAREFEDLLQFAWERHVLGDALDKGRRSREAFVLYLAAIDPEHRAVDEATRLRLIMQAGAGPGGFAQAVLEARELRAGSFPGGAPGPSEAAELALECAFRRLDPHSGFMDREAWAEMMRSITGEYSGIGVVIRHADEPLVVEVFPDGPSAGNLVPGDRIVRVDGADVQGLSSSEYLSRVRGPEGTPVTLTVRRGDELLDVPLVRRQVRSRAVQSVTAGPDRDILVLHLRSYTEGCASELKRALAGPAGPLRGVVLDLRNNPGGTVDDAVAIVDLFIDEGPVIVERGRDRKDLSADAPGSAIPVGVPLVVVVNRYSASASELTAGALQDHGRAVVVGERTFGKGTVQEIYRMGDRGAKVTIARFYTPSGRSTQLYGIAPDILRVDEVVAKWARLTPAGDGALFERDYDNAIPADAQPEGFRPGLDAGPLAARLRERMSGAGGYDPALDPDDSLLQEVVSALGQETPVPRK